MIDPAAAPVRGEGFALELPAAAGSVAIVRHAMQGALHELGVPAERIADVLLATSEACSNAVVHAYPAASARGAAFRVALELAGDGAAMVSVRDHGQGLTPSPGGGGLGLGHSIIRALSEGCEIRAPNDGGVEVVMTFDLPAGTSAAGEFETGGPG